MTDKTLPAFLDLLQRELGADDAYLQLGGKASDGGGRLFHTIGEGTHVVVVFTEPPTEGDAVRERVKLLSGAFQKTLDAAVAEVAAPRQTVDVARHRLDEQLTALCERAGAVRAFVFDVDSPIVWGASSLHGQDAASAAESLEKAMLELRERSELLEPAQDHTQRLTLDGGVEALVRPFAGQYVLTLLFAEPISEPVALGAIVHAAGLIEKLVLALPPIEPNPDGGAKVIRLRRT